MQEKPWRRRLIWSLYAVALVTLPILAASPKACYAIKGYLCGEAFYLGYPSSYYRNAILDGRPAYAASRFWRWYSEFKRALGIEIESTNLVNYEVFLFRTGGCNAMPVALELLSDPNPDVRFEAMLAIDNVV